MKRRIFHSGLSLLVLLSLLAACAPFSGPDTPTPQPAPTPAAAAPSPAPPKPRPEFTPQSASAVSPIVVARRPARGEELPPDGAIELAFDRPMDQAAVEAAFSLSPQVGGSFAWPDARTLRFTPSDTLERGALYDAVLGQGARATDGAALASPLQFRFSTRGYLEVAQVIPAPETPDAQAAATITVIFNRPVVPLVTSLNKGSLPTPLTLRPENGGPAVTGQGQWLNSAIFVFRPDTTLLGGTRYSGEVAGLSAADGSPLKEPFRWQFSVAAPQVVTTVPVDGDDHVSVEPSIRVQLNQPVSLAAAQAGFQLLGPAGQVRGALGVEGDTLVFTPTERLAFEQQYTAQVEAALAEPYRWRFTTVPLPRILSVEPADGSQDAPPFSDVVIQFNTVISPATVAENLAMSPPLSPTQVYSFFSEYDYRFYLSFGAQPSASYEVRLGPDISDPWGNRTGQSLASRFRTGPLPPSVQMLSPNNIATYSALEPAAVLLRSVNMPQADLALYRASVADLRSYRSWYDQPPAEADLLRRWSVPLDSPLNASVNTRVELSADRGRLAPGVYVLRLEQPDGNSPSWQLLVISPYNLTLKAGAKQALVWATSLENGAPVPGLDLLFTHEDGSVLGSATTDGQGVAQIRLENAARRSVFVSSNCPQTACESFAAIGEGWNQGIGSWDFGLESSWDYPELNAFVYTDRPIYRPGQRVLFKGLLRDERDARYSLPKTLGEVQLQISSPNGEVLYDQMLPLSDLGSFDDELSLAEGAALGTYSMQLAAGGRGWNFPFTVAAYRPPEFEVTVEAPTESVRGQAIRAEAQLAYFFGGPVAKVPIEWRLLVEPYSFSVPGLERFSFGDRDDPWACLCWWRPAPEPVPSLSGSGTTDARGRLLIELPPDLKDAFGEPISGSLRLTLEATASGRDNQAISGRTSLIAHQGNSYVGLAPQSYVASAGQEQAIDLVVVDTEGTRQAGRPIDVEVLRYNWQNSFVEDGTGSGSWQSVETRTSVARQRLTSDARGQATLRFTPAEGGSYRVIARVDGGATEVMSSLFVWVAGPDYVPWRRDNNDRMSLISDRSSYRVGETAEILIPSPYARPVWALVSVERGDIITHEVVRLSSNSTVYRLPIQAGHAPNIFFSAVLISGPEAPGRAGSQKIGMLPLEILPDPQTISVTLTPEQASYGPGETARYQVRTTDSAGQPIAADLSLDLVDKAVLSLQPRTPNAIRQAFYGRRGLGISTASGLSISGNRLLEQLDQAQQAGGRGGGLGEGRAGEVADSAAAPAATAAPAAPEAPAAGAPQAENAALPEGITVRSEFADTAFWQASFTTDAQGQGSLELKLPDNLTTWVLRGVAHDAATRVGEGTVEILASKPLLVRPVTPRFLVVGDRAQLQANVSNNTDAELNAEVRLTAVGVTLAGPEIQTVRIPARGEARLSWDVSVPPPQPSQTSTLFADLTFSAVAGQFSDAARPRLASGPAGQIPIYRYSVPETVGTGGRLSEAGARTEAIALPPGVDPSRGELTVRLEPSLAAGMREGLEYLEYYEFEGVEFTVSRFLPNVLTYQALKDAGISNAELEQRLPDLVREGLERLQRAQNGDGGWGWWPLEASNPHVSAYVVLGLLRAQEAGFDVDGAMLSRGLDYLSAQIKPVSVTTSPGEANLQAFVLFVVNEHSPGSARDEARALLEQREKLAAYARAFLAMALAQADANDPGIKTLLSDLNNQAVLSATGAHWEEDDYDRWAMNTDTRSTAIVLSALGRLDPDNELAPNALRWLMVARKGGIWETTQETAWALIALGEWLARTAELQGSYEYAALLDTSERLAGSVNNNNIDQPVITRIPAAELLGDTSSRLTVGRGEGPGVLYYTAHLNAYLPVPEVKALERGIAVSRRYTLASCVDTAEQRCPSVTQARVGELLRVELALVATRDLYYLRLEDMLPAGAEAVDSGLATTSIFAPAPQLESLPPKFEDGPVPALGFPGPHWWWNWWSRSELRDERVVLFADTLGKGSYQYSYTLRLTQPGTFNVIPTVAQESYFPEVYGRGDGSLFEVLP
jgi:hypothetical protein